MRDVMEDPERRRAAAAAAAGAAPHGPTRERWSGRQCHAANPPREPTPESDVGPPSAPTVQIGQQAPEVGRGGLRLVS
jgi:hypothetical protein